MDRVPLIEEWENSIYMMWAKNFCARNQWRVQTVIGEFEDCLAECSLVYVECRQRYGDKVNSPQHFMRLFQMMCWSWFNTCSTKESNNRNCGIFIDTEDEVFLASNKVNKENMLIESDANLTVALGEASSDLKAVLNIFFNAPQEILQVLRSEANSYCPRQFFNQILVHLGISKAKAPALQKELKRLLSK